MWIQADPAEVWTAYTDPARMAEWQTGSPVVEDIQGSGAPGTTYVSRRGPLAARTVVLEADRPHRHVTRTSSALGLRFTVVSRLEPVDKGTRLSLAVETEWPRGLGLLGRAVELAILSRREAAKELSALKALVERRP